MGSATEEISDSKDIPSIVNSEEFCSFDIKDRVPQLPVLDPTVSGIVDLEEIEINSVSIEVAKLPEVETRPLIGRGSPYKHGEKLESAVPKRVKDLGKRVDLSDYSKKPEHIEEESPLKQEISPEIRDVEVINTAPAQKPVSKTMRKKHHYLAESTETETREKKTEVPSFIIKGGAEEESKPRRYSSRYFRKRQEVVEDIGDWDGLISSLSDEGYGEETDDEGDFELDVSQLNDPMSLEDVYKICGVQTGYGGTLVSIRVREALEDYMNRRVYAKRGAEVVIKYAEGNLFPKVIEDREEEIEESLLDYFSYDDFDLLLYDAIRVMGYNSED